MGKVGVAVTYHETPDFPNYGDEGLAVKFATTHDFRGAEAECSHVYAGGSVCGLRPWQHMTPEEARATRPFVDETPEGPIDQPFSFNGEGKLVVMQDHSWTEWRGDTLVAITSQMPQGMECPAPSGNCVNCQVVAVTEPPKDAVEGILGVSTAMSPGEPVRKMLIALPHNSFRWFGVRMDWSYLQRDLVFYAWGFGKVVSKSLRDMLAPPPPPPAGGFSVPLTAVAAFDRTGAITHLGCEGEWYAPVKLSWRVRLHNWLVRRGA